MNKLIKVRYLWIFVVAVFVSSVGCANAIDLYVVSRGSEIDLVEFRDELKVRNPEYQPVGEIGMVAGNGANIMELYVQKYSIDLVSETDFKNLAEDRGLSVTRKDPAPGLPQPEPVPPAWDAGMLIEVPAPEGRQVIMEFRSILEIEVNRFHAFILSYYPQIKSFGRKKKTSTIYRRNGREVVFEKFSRKYRIYENQKNAFDEIKRHFGSQNSSELDCAGILLRF